jgi:hypothetical protein
MSSFLRNHSIKSLTFSLKEYKLMENAMIFQCKG